MSRKRKRNKKSGISKTFKSLLTKSFWKSHLPWPQKIVRKPKIRLTNPFIGKKFPEFLRSKYLLLGIIYIIIFYFFSGGMYFLIGAYREIPMGYGEGNPPEPIIFLRSLNDQFIIEGILAASFIFMSLGGFFLIYLSSKNFYKPSSSYAYLGLGILLIIIAFFLIETSMYMKGIHLYDEDLYSIKILQSIF
ncbi:MAG: hypothetical protein ACTSPY_07385 [Candidatus Helarchaeota archaeon]